MLTNGVLGDSNEKLGTVMGWACSGAEPTVSAPMAAAKINLARRGRVVIGLDWDWIMLITYNWLVGLGLDVEKAAY